MKILSGGELHLQTACEAEIASRVWNYQQALGVGRLILVHHHSLEPTRDEVEYFDRECIHGPLTLGSTQVERITAALQSLANHDDSYDGITATTAALVLHALAVAREKAAFRAFESDPESIVHIERTLLTETN